MPADFAVTGNATKIFLEEMQKHLNEDAAFQLSEFNKNSRPTALIFVYSGIHFDKASESLAELKMTERPNVPIIIIPIVGKEGHPFIPLDNEKTEKLLKDIFWSNKNEVHVMKSETPQSTVDFLTEYAKRYENMPGLHALQTSLNQLTYELGLITVAILERSAEVREEKIALTPNSLAQLMESKSPVLLKVEAKLKALNTMGKMIDNIKDNIKTISRTFAPTEEDYQAILGQLRFFQQYCRLPEYKVVVDQATSSSRLKRAFNYFHHTATANFVDTVTNLIDALIAQAEKKSGIAEEKLPQPQNK